MLDLGANIYIWNGAEANKFEKVAALNFAINVKNHERKMKAVLHYPQDMGGETEDNFWKALGGKPAQINPAKPDEEIKFDGADRSSYRLWHLSDATGSVKGSQIKERPLKKSMLDSNDTYILELYDIVYVW